jgi:hypothetical protein
VIGCRFKSGPGLQTRPGRPNGKVAIADQPDPGLTVLDGNIGSTPHWCKRPGAKGKRRVSLRSGTAGTGRRYDPVNGTGKSVANTSLETPESAEETDTETDDVSADTKEEQVYPRRRICVSAGDYQVEVEGPDELGLVADVVAGLWQLAHPGPPARIGFTAGESLITELARDEPGDEEDG